MGEGAASEERADTQRVVLRRERVIVLPDSVDAARLAQLLDADDYGQEKAIKRALTSLPVDAWIVVGEFTGSSKERAIETHAGKAGTFDAIPGAYKAPTKTAWSGGLVYEKPPKPKVERAALED
jgi:hypothetical protein